MADEIPTEGRKGIDYPNDFIIKKGRKERRKATKVQKLMRIQQVVTWMLEGSTYTQVIQKGKKKWGLTGRPVEYYIAEAREQVEALAAQEVQAAATLALSRLSELYYAALEEGDTRTALEVVKTQNKMLGLNAPDKLEARTVENWDSMSVAEQLEKIGTIVERAEEAKQLN